MMSPDPLDTRPRGMARSWIMGTEAFEREMPHHDGIKALWESRWKVPCSQGTYPFHDGKYEDFEPIFHHLIEDNINDATSPAYAEAFLPHAEFLIALADAALAAGRPRDASALYLRACAVLRIARFPYISAAHADRWPAKWRAWTLQKAAYLRAGATWAEPLAEVAVPCSAGGAIPAYVRRPAGDGPAPAVLLMTGLDGYRPDNTARCGEFLARGWAAVVVEVPGTADCPADPADPAAGDRAWGDVLDWMGRDGGFDMRRVMVWGLSAGGYHAVRAAHTHADRIVAVVAQGAGCHHFFGEEWLARADRHEYPFRLTPFLALKHGYESVEEYKKSAMSRFSLLDTGILEKPCTRLLLVNGTHDGLMPIEDSMILFEHGTPKEARFFPGALHMGYPLANASIYPWMESVVACVGLS